jgi:AcrR family transcriptional regulator
MPNIRTPREQWIEQGLQALATGGPDAVRIEALARSLGVTKGGFYWHFDGRRALLDELLDEWERLVVDEVEARVDATPGTARDKLVHLFDIATAAGTPLVRLELAIRDWARRDGSVARHLSRVDTRRVQYMRDLFRALCDDDEAEVRAVLVMSLFIGGPAIAADFTPRTRRQVITLAISRLVA